MNWPTISFLFEPRDLWIGAYINWAKRRLYILPLPTLGIVLQWPKPIVEETVAPKRPQQTLILAYSFDRARQYAWAKGLQGQWDYAGSAHHLYGRGEFKLVKLEGWATGKSPEFIDMVKQLEARL